MALNGGGRSWSETKEDALRVSEEGTNRESVGISRGRERPFYFEGAMLRPSKFCVTKVSYPSSHIFCRIDKSMLASSAADPSKPIFNKSIGDTINKNRLQDVTFLCRVLFFIDSWHRLSFKYLTYVWMMMYFPGNISWVTFWIHLDYILLCRLSRDSIHIPITMQVHSFLGK